MSTESDDELKQLEETTPLKVLSGYSLGHTMTMEEWLARDKVRVEENRKRKAWLNSLVRNDDDNDEFEG